AAQLGIIIKGGEVLERTQQVDVAVLDKTGTITEGRLRLVDVIPAEGEDRDEVLGLAAALEARSEHPVATAIATAAPEAVGADARRAGHADRSVTDFANQPGLGVTGTVDGRRVTVGRASL